MKWYKKDTNTNQNPKIKALKRKHGIIGKAIYFEIVELIAESIERDNQENWGFLPKEYSNDHELLADEIGIPLEQLESTLTTLYSLELLQKIENKIKCDQVIKRCDDYIERVIRTKSDKVPMESLQSKDEVIIKSDIRTKEEQEREEEKNILSQKNEKALMQEKKERKITSYERLPEEKQQAVHRLGYFYEDLVGTKITNWGKQAKAVTAMLKAGYSEKSIQKVITFMATKDEWWMENGFDLMTVANQIGRYKAKEELQKRRDGG